MKDGVLINVDVDGAVWRWIKGFHAALYANHSSIAKRRQLLADPTSGHSSLHFLARGNVMET